MRSSARGPYTRLPGTFLPWPGLTSPVRPNDGRRSMRCHGTTDSEPRKVDDAAHSPIETCSKWRIAIERAALKGPCELWTSVVRQGGMAALSPLRARTHNQ